VEQQTWIVVADGARARIFSHVNGRVPALAPALDHDLVATHMRNQDGEHSPHSPTPESDPHRHGQLELARVVAHELETARQHGLQRIVLVAPPRALGDLRKACTTGVHALVTDELGKDLTHMAVHELTEHLQEFLGPTPTPQAH
jgi:protein required for attachment to host cells